MGARLTVAIEPPFLHDRERQRDAAHVRCTTYLAKRLQAAGWKTATEVEVGQGRARGWIDVLAFHPATRLLIVIEVKTEIRDLGQIERIRRLHERGSRFARDASAASLIPRRDRNRHWDA